MQAVPDTESEVLTRLRELEAELTPLAEQKRKIETRTFRYSALKSCLLHDPHVSDSAERCAYLFRPTPKRKIGDGPSGAQTNSSV